MRRKVIQQGNNSYTLTLPIGWIREENILPGTEVLVEQEDKHLVVSLPKDARKPESKIEIELKDFDKRTIKNVINIAYRKGYDEIILEYNNKEQLNIIKEYVMTSLLGFEVVNENSKTCTVQNIAEPSGEKFWVILRKLFLLIKLQGDETLQDIGKKKADHLDKVMEIRTLVDKYTNYCRRVVIKDKIGGTKNSYILFLIISRLSLIYQAYLCMYKFASQQKKIDMSKDCLAALEEANRLYNLFYEAFYEKDMEKAHKVISSQTKLFYDNIRELFQKRKGQENVYLYHIGELARMIQMQASTILGLADLQKFE